MRALVTGGGGFLGGVVVRQLLDRGWAVRSFSRADYPSLRAIGAETCRGDLADPAAVSASCRECDIVFHVAAKAGIGGRRRDYYRANVVGTRHVIAACRERGIPRLVYTSSPSVVFDGHDMEGVDESVPYAPRFISAYPATKAQAEQMVLAASSEQMATIALRPHLVWGPGDNHLVPGILARGRAGRLRRVGGVPKLADFTYVDDAAAAHLLAADRLKPGSAVAGRAFFISQGTPVPLWEFVDRILKAASLPVVKNTISPRTAYWAGWVCETVYAALRLGGDPPITRFLAEELATAHWFDISAARRELGYRPKVSLEEGLRRLQQWLKDSEQSQR